MRCIVYGPCSRFRRYAPEQLQLLADGFDGRPRCQQVEAVYYVMQCEKKLCCRIGENVVCSYIMLYNIAVAWGGAHIGRRPKTHFEDTWGPGLGFNARSAKTRRRQQTHGEDSEDTWASEDTFPAKTRVGRRVVAKTPPERAVLAKACPEVKP